MPENQLAEKTPAPFAVLKDFLSRDDFKGQIALALPKHLTADRMLRVALTAALHQPKIAEVVMTPGGKASLMKALLTASQLGLEVDGRQGHLVPFNDKRLGMIVQFIAGYQGLIQVAYNHPKVRSIWFAVVHEQDHFVYEDGLDRKLVHRRYAGSGEPGPLTHAYAVCEMDGGAKTFVCLNKREVEKAKKSSRAAVSEYSPWSTHPEAMWAKTAVRALAKQMPQSNELRAILQVDDDNDGLTEEERFQAARPVSDIQLGAALPGEVIPGKPDNQPLPPPEPATPDAVEEKKPARAKKEEKPAPPRATPVEVVKNLMLASKIDGKDVMTELFAKQKCQQGDTLEKLPEETITWLIDNWMTVAADIKGE